MKSVSVFSKVAFAVATFMAFLLLPFYSAHADSEFSSATNLTIASTGSPEISSEFTSEVTEELYKFSLSTAGRLSVDLYTEVNNNGITFVIYDSDAEEIVREGSSYNRTWGWSKGIRINSALGFANNSYTYDLAAGDYYLKTFTVAETYTSNYKGTGKFTFDLKFDNAQETIAEPNKEGDFKSAATVQIATPFIGQLAKNDTSDLIKIDVDEDCALSFTGKSYFNKLSITVYDLLGNKIGKGYTDPSKTLDVLGYSDFVYETDALKAGTVFVLIKGSGTGVYNLQIDKLYTLDACTIDEIPSQSYSQGLEITPDLSIVHNGKALVAGVDYTVDYSNNIKVGKATALIKGIGKFKGEVKKEFEIVPYSLSEADFKAIKDQQYKGAAVSPIITAKIGDSELKQGTDFTITYSNNNKIGKASVVIEGRGNYAGKVTLSYNITPEKINFKSVKNLNSKSATLTWAKNDKVTGYYIYRADKKKGTYKKVATVSSKKTTYVDKKVKEGKTYYYKVVGYKKVSKKLTLTSPDSKIRSIKIKK